MSGRITPSFSGRITPSIFNGRVTPSRTNGRVTPSSSFATPSAKSGTIGVKRSVKPPPPPLFDDASSAAMSKITAGSRASKYVGMTAQQLGCNAELRQTNDFNFFAVTGAASPSRLSAGSASPIRSSMASPVHSGTTSPPASASSDNSQGPFSIVGCRYPQEALVLDDHLFQHQRLVCRRRLRCHLHLHPVVHGRAAEEQTNLRRRLSVPPATTRRLTMILRVSRASFQLSGGLSEYSMLAEGCVRLLVEAL